MGHVILIVLVRVRFVIVVIVLFLVVVLVLVVVVVAVVVAGGDHCGIGGFCGGSCGGSASSCGSGSMTSLRPSTIRVCTSRPSEALRHMSSTKCVFSSGFLLLTILQPLKRQVLVLSDAAGRCRQKIVIALLLMSIH